MNLSTSDDTLVAPKSSSSSVPSDRKESTDAEAEPENSTSQNASGRRISSASVQSGNSVFDLPKKPLDPIAERRHDPLGLTVVHEPETAPSLDIVFVHGLGGTSRATWSKHRNSEYFWPNKWLPSEPGIKSARILSFGYNAQFKATGPAPISGIADFAKDLLYSMKFAKDDSLEELGIGEVNLVVLGP